MPSNVSHNHFAKAILKKLPEQITDIIQKDLPAFLVGSQGPDLLFYLRFEKAPLNELGEIIHNSFTAHKMFSASFEYAKQQDSSTIMAFLMGQLCHYAMDANLHSYIYHREKDLIKFYKKDAHPYIHVVYESALDYICVRDYIKKNPAFYKGYKNLKISKASNKEIAKYYTDVVAPMYGMDLPLKKAARMTKLMRLFLRICDDISGIKYLIIRSVEKLLKQPMSISAFMRPKKERKSEDWLNHNRMQYPLYRGEDIMDNKTVEEMLDMAICDGVELITNAYDYINGKLLDDTLYYRNYNGARQKP